MPWYSLAWSAFWPLLIMLGLPALTFRLELGPRARQAILTEIVEPSDWLTRKVLGCLLRFLFWFSDVTMFWMPPFGAIFEREDERRAAQRATSPGTASTRHEHIKRLRRHENGVVSVDCDGCRLSVPVRPPASAQRSVAALERWISRLEARLQQDSQA